MNLTISIVSVLWDYVIDTYQTVCDRRCWYVVFISFVCWLSWQQPHWKSHFVFLFAFQPRHLFPKCRNDRMRCKCTCRKKITGQKHTMHKRSKIYRVKAIERCCAVERVRNRKCIIVVKPLFYIQYYIDSRSEIWIMLEMWLKAHVFTVLLLFLLYYECDLVFCFFYSFHLNDINCYRHYEF